MVVLLPLCQLVDYFVISTFKTQFLIKFTKIENFMYLKNFYYENENYLFFQEF